jgi:hypothetical protein
MDCIDLPKTNRTMRTGPANDRRACKRKEDLSVALTLTLGSETSELIDATFLLAFRAEVGGSVELATGSRPGQSKDAVAMHWVSVRALCLPAGELLHRGGRPCSHREGSLGDSDASIRPSREAGHGEVFTYGRELHGCARISGAPTG